MTERLLALDLPGPVPARLAPRARALSALNGGSLHPTARAFRLGLLSEMFVR